MRKKRWQGMERRKEIGNQEQKGGGDKHLKWR